MSTAGQEKVGQAISAERGVAKGTGRYLGPSEAGGMRAHSGWRLGDLELAGGARAPAWGGGGPRPSQGCSRSRLQASPPALHAPGRAGDTPRGESSARGGNAPETREPQARPPGGPHLAKESSHTLAVELHLQPGSGARWPDPSPRTFCDTGSRTAAAEDQASRAGQGPAPSQTRKSPAFHARGCAAFRPGVHSPLQREP